jgi:hydrogenase expression/formation protein HypE
MHDPTEGGVLNGLVELACASAVHVDVDADAVPVRSETRTLCAAMGVDPLRVLGSGALLATVPGDEAQSAVAALDAEGVDATVVATVDEPTDATEAGVTYDGQHYTGGVRDEMYDLWE